MTAKQSPMITPEAFWIQFSSELRSKWNDETEKLYEDGTLWTEYITTLIAGMDTAFHCHADIEYWPRVDVSYFDRQGVDWSSWSREAAIEIENNEAWTQELCKLLEINAGLKVLIAYSATRSCIDGILNEFPKIYTSRKYVTTPCNWLFIFGPHGDNGGQLQDFIAIKSDGQTMTEITGDARVMTR